MAARIGFVALTGGSLLAYLIAFEQAARVWWVFEPLTGAVVLIVAACVVEKINWG